MYNGGKLVLSIDQWRKYLLVVVALLQHSPWKERMSTLNNANCPLYHTQLKRLKRINISQSYIKQKYSQVIQSYLFSSTLAPMNGGDIQTIILKIGVAKGFNMLEELRPTWDWVGQPLIWYCKTEFVFKVMSIPCN